MEIRKPCTAANLLIAAAILAWLAYAWLAVQAADGATRQASLGVAGALTVLALAVNGRQVAGRSTRTLTTAVGRAPQQSFWRGYEARGEDMTAGGSDDDTTDLMTIGR